jgi:hypothetical protein
MYTKKTLEKKTIKELKDIAMELEINFDDKIKKAQLIELICDSDIDMFDSIPDLPKVYGKNKMVFMIRDPFNGFVYWNIKDDLAKKHKLDDQTLNKYLRVYDITDDDSPETSFATYDIKINPNANSWYINFPKPNRTYVIDYGYFKNNRFVTVIRSNSATLPRTEVSQVSDEKSEWVLTNEQFELIMQASGADVMFQHDGSQELMKFLAGNLEGNISS